MMLICVHRINNNKERKKNVTIFMIMQEKTVTSHNDHNEPNTEGSPLPATQGFHVKLTVINSNIQSGVAEKEDPDHQDYIIWPNLNVYAKLL